MPFLSIVSHHRDRDVAALSLRWPAKMTSRFDIIILIIVIFPIFLRSVPSEDLSVDADLAQHCTDVPGFVNWRPEESASSIQSVYDDSDQSQLYFEHS